MPRRSSRRKKDAKGSRNRPLPSNIERGLASLVDGNEKVVATMLSMDKGSDAKALVKGLGDCMILNDLSAEALLARFFSVSVLSPYCSQWLGVSGKGNEATLAARIGKKWSKPDFVIQELCDDVPNGQAPKREPSGSENEELAPTTKKTKRSKSDCIETENSDCSDNLT